MNTLQERLKSTSRELGQGLALESSVILIVSTLVLAFLIHHPGHLPLPRWLAYNILLLAVLPLLVACPIHPQRKRQSGLWWIIWALALAATLTCTLFLLRMRKLSPSPWMLGGLGVFTLFALIYLGRKSKLGLSDYGICLGRFRKWGTACIVLFGLMVLVLIYASRLEAFQRTYPLFRQAEEGWRGFLTVQGYFGGYWFAWEFFFRGFMLFGLARRYGAPTAVFIQTIPFTFMHFGKPELEVYASFVAGIALGHLDWWGKSILPSLLLHWMVALSMDLLAVVT